MLYHDKVEEIRVELRTNYAPKALFWISLCLWVSWLQLKSLFLGSLFNGVLSWTPVIPVLYFWGQWESSGGHHAVSHCKCPFGFPGHDFAPQCNLQNNHKVLGWAVLMWVWKSPLNFARPTEQNIACTIQPRASHWLLLYLGRAWPQCLELFLTGWMWLCDQELLKCWFEEEVGPGASAGKEMGGLYPRQLSIPSPPPSLRVPST